MSDDSQTVTVSRPLQTIYAVSGLVREAKSVLEGSFPLVWVEGELSNIATPASGHIYFTLKDEAAQMRCAMFKMRNRYLNFTPKNGMQVLMRVRVTIYEGRGDFQAVVEHMEEAGSGALQRAYEALKQRLGDEGLFDQAHKQNLPGMPNSIGIVSSASGAAVHDILTVLQRRYPLANVVLYPTAVQGAEAAQQIVAAIEMANQRQESDLLIISRGGGSIEDLWCFNDEKVARAIFASDIPTISAVGHEVDFTIADFVADVRAATPSIAAELAVPDAAELAQKYSKIERTLSNLIINAINDGRQKLDYCAARLKHPQQQLAQSQQQLDNLLQRLQRQAATMLSQQQLQLANYQRQLQLLSPVTLLSKYQSRFEQVQKQLHGNIKQHLQQQRMQLEQTIRTFAAVSPLNTLERGYSITSAVDSDRVIQSANQVELDQQVNITLKQGRLVCAVKEKFDS